MGWLKEMRENGMAKNAATEAQIKSAEATMKLYIDLTKARDRSLKREDVDKGRLLEFLVTVPGIVPEREIPQALTALRDNAWEVRWAAVHTLAVLVGRLHNQSATGNKKAITESVSQQIKSCLNDADDRVRAEAATAIDRVKRHQ